MNEKYNGYLILVFTVSLWAFSSGVIVPWIHKSGVFIIGAGAAIATLYITLILWQQKRLHEIRLPAEYMKSLVIIGLLVTATNGLFFAGLKMTSVANALLGHYFAPILVVLIFAPKILGQRIQSRHVIASLLGLSGLALVLSSQLGSKDLNIGAALALASSFFFAWHIVIETRLAHTSPIDPLVAVWYKSFVPAVVFAPFVLFNIAKQGITFPDSLKILFFGAVILGFTFTLLFRALKLVSSQEASIFFYIEPVGSIVFAGLVWHQSLSMMTAVGGALILLSGIITIQRRTTP